MIVASRPLRFLAVTLCGWTTMRVAWLWPTIDSVPDVIRAVAPIPRAIAATRPRIARRGQVLAIAIPPRHRATLSPGHMMANQSILRIQAAPPVIAQPALVVPSPPVVAVALAAPVDPGQPGSTMLLARSQPTFGARFTASSWLIARDGSRAVPFAGQLGGSQAGVRLTYALIPDRRLAVAARFSSALGSRQREAALGFDWQPTTLPVHLFAEQRFGIERARGGPSVGMIAGLPPTPVVGGFRAEGYGQAGGIARGGVEGFVDGSVRLARPVASLGAARLDLGAGAWGGAQRGAARLDLGPSLGLALPITGRTLRLSLDWRQRIAGHAAPGSGPALSLGSDF